MKYDKLMTLSSANAPILILHSLNDKCMLGTKVILVVSLVNPSQASIVVNGRLQIAADLKYYEAYDLQFNILDPIGTQIALLGVIEDPISPYPKVSDFVSLLPGDSYTKTIVVSDYFALESIGTYKISAEYHNYHTGHEFGCEAWLGKIKSDVVEFNIT